MRAPKLLFDGRNALVDEATSGLGFEYVGVGRAHTSNNSRSTDMT